MAHYSNKKHHNWLSGIGTKVKHVAELAGTIKTGFDIARGAYSLFNTVSPYLAGAALLL